MRRSWLLNALDLMPRGFALLATQFRCTRASQPPLRAVHHRGRHLQIAYQFGGGPARSFLLRLPLRFEKQLGIIQNTFADRRRGN